MNLRVTALVTISYYLIFSINAFGSGAYFSRICKVIFHSGSPRSELNQKRDPSNDSLPWERKLSGALKEQLSKNTQEPGEIVDIIVRVDDPVEANDTVIYWTYFPQFEQVRKEDYWLYLGLRNQRKAQVLNLWFQQSEPEYSTPTLRLLHVRTRTDFLHEVLEYYQQKHGNAFRSANLKTELIGVD